LKRHSNNNGVAGAIGGAIFAQKGASEMMRKIKTKQKTRPNVSGTVGELSVYDGAAHVGYFVHTDDGRVQVYDVEGAPVGIFDNYRDAARAVLKVEAVL
jgi:hypothetical protein